MKPRHGKCLTMALWPSTTMAEKSALGNCVNTHSIVVCQLKIARSKPRKSVMCIADVAVAAFAYAKVGSASATVKVKMNGAQKILNGNRQRQLWRCFYFGYQSFR